MDTYTDLVLSSGGRSLSGWTRIRVTRGIERLPSDFDIEMTDGYSVLEHALLLKPGDPCQIRMGAQLVITGYIDRVVPSISAARHGIRVVGRGKCADLVDCGADIPGSQISAASILDVARMLAITYGISVNSLHDAAKETILPQQNILFGETAFEVIERDCRVGALLAYDQPDGSLLLSRVSTKNVGKLSPLCLERAFYEWSMDQRFSEYRVVAQSMNVLSDVGDSGNLIYTVKDPGVVRKRIHYIVAEATMLGKSDIVEQRARWEAKRRLGRSHMLTLIVDTWLGPDGKLWEPNTQISIDPYEFPGLKLEILERDNNWLIGEVTYNRDGDRGTTAMLTLSFPDAYNVFPIILNPQWGDIQPGVVQ